MKPLSRFFVAGLVAGAAFASRATIEDFKEISIDFADPIAATNKATWSEPDKFTVSKNGLGRDGEVQSLRDGWIETKPLALGLSWRTAMAVSVRVTIEPPPVEITLPNGQKMTPYGGNVYARYSPDLKHWSSWQALQPDYSPASEQKKISGRQFGGLIQVPERERERYKSLCFEYSRMDVPWKSDEEAAVRWILEKQPDFFAKQIPFIGYIEFLFEGGFYGGQRIKSLKADIHYNMSGMHMAPKSGVYEKEREASPWRFTAH